MEGDIGSIPDTELPNTRSKIIELHTNLIKKLVCANIKTVLLLFFNDIVLKVMEGDLGSIPDTELPNTRSKNVIFISSTFNKKTGVNIFV